MDLPSSFSLRRAVSCCDRSRPRARIAPSTSRRYRSFSPKLILQSVITILQFAIICQELDLPCFQEASGRLGPSQLSSPLQIRGALRGRWKGEVSHSKYGSAAAKLILDKYLSWRTPCSKAAVRPPPIDRQERQIV